ncbi:MAG: hypothetical protein KJ655_04980 [Candidatus Thermoplasmatota archaeon]|nr:hypothetical protein [Candidatus Thermoplasmatota archaeon]
MKIMEGIDRLKKCAEKPSKMAVLIIVVMGIIYAVFAGITFLPGRNSHVTLDEEVYFTRVDNTTLNVIIYITNDGLTDSGDVDITLYVTDSQGISQSQCKQQVGVIGSDKTKEITFTTQATPDKKYNVDVLVFEDGKKTLSGSGTLQSPTVSGTTGAGEGVVIEERKYQKPPTPTPGFETLLLLCAIPIALLVIKRHKRKA